MKQEKFDLILSITSIHFGRAIKKIKLYQKVGGEAGN
tara:strand:- start:273 stop:383 length:111 start_codon:yes stop_codon:yes gene_type:complete